MYTIKTVRSRVERGMGVYERRWLLDVEPIDKSRTIGTDQGQDRMWRICDWKTKDWPLDMEELLMAAQDLNGPQLNCLKKEKFVYMFFTCILLLYDIQRRDGK